MPQLKDQRSCLSSLRDDDDSREKRKDSRRMSSSAVLNLSPEDLSHIHQSPKDSQVQIFYTFTTWDPGFLCDILSQDVAQETWIPSSKGAKYLDL